MRPQNFPGRALVVLMLLQTMAVFSQHGPQIVEYKKLTTNDYIARYKDIAIREMERSGIPASITLAQGIHESGNGNSDLARKANNHFGIKCHEWKGQGYYMWDDDPKESCFRVYENGDSSYIDHTNFLMTRKRYAFLFEYESVDYVNWAHGLRKAGYATDTTYPQKLISTIERHKLYQYDIVMKPLIASNSVQPEQKTAEEVVYVIPAQLQRKLRNKTKSSLFKEYKKGIFQQNASAYAFAKANETALEIATRFDIPYRKFLLFNDMVDGDKLIDNQYCFIQPKKSKYKGSEIYHQVKENETMYEISQFYGLKLQDLLDRNLLTEGQEPKNGEMILLNEKAFKAPTLRAVEKEVEIVKPVVQKQAEVVVKQDIKVTETKVEQKKLIAESSTYPESVYNSGQQLNTSIGNETEQVIPEFPTKFEYEPIKLEDERKKELPKVDTKKTELVSVEVKTEAKENTAKKAEIAKTENKFLMHIVQSNETLYSIGKKYGIEWEQIKKYNNLASNELSAKQSLKIPR
jgi:LysM repeat protein